MIDGLAPFGLQGISIGTMVTQDVPEAMIRSTGWPSCRHADTHERTGDDTNHPLKAPRPRQGGALSSSTEALSRRFRSC